MSADSARSNSLCSRGARPRDFEPFLLSEGSSSLEPLSDLLSPSARFFFSPDGAFSPLELFRWKLLLVSIDRRYGGARAETFRSSLTRAIKRRLQSMLIRCLSARASRPYGRLLTPRDPGRRANVHTERENRSSPRNTRARISVDAEEEIARITKALKYFTRERGCAYKYADAYMRWLNRTGVPRPREISTARSKLFIERTKLRLR